MLHAMLLSLDGRTVFDHTGTCTATLEAAAVLGQDMGAAIRLDAGEAFFETLARDIEAEIA